MAGIVRQRSAWLILGIGVVAYVAAVVHRTSLGVAGSGIEPRVTVQPARSTSRSRRAAGWDGSIGT